MLLLIRCFDRTIRIRTIPSSPTTLSSVTRKQLMCCCPQLQVRYSFKCQHRPTIRPSYTNRQQWRFWNESAPNPIYVAMEEEARKKAEFEEKDVVGKRLREIESTPGDTQTIWASVFLDGKLVNGTQITIPKYDANIDMIKYAVKERCSEIFTDIAAITFQVLPTQYKRKKGRRKLTRKNRVLKPEAYYDMALHGGESEDAGIIVKAHTKKMRDGNHFAYGEKAALDLGIDFIKAIMQDYHELPVNNGMKVLPDVPDLECAIVKNVVLRNGITEPFWNRVLEISEGSSQKTAMEQQHQQSTDTSPESDNHGNASNEEDDQESVDTPGHQYRVCVVGSNGIGKTTTTAIFIRLLLQKGRSVVYHIRTADKSRWVYEFIPNRIDVEHNPQNVTVQVIPEQKFNVSLTSTLVDNIQNYYIVDTGTTFEENCNPDDQVKCRVVLIASPNERHWGGNKLTMLRGGKMSGTFLYYPSWTLSELLLSYSMMVNSTINENLTHTIIQKRYHEVGGIPGHILAPLYTYCDIISTQTDHITTLTEQQLKLMVRNHWKYMGTINTIVGYARTNEVDLFSSTMASPVSTKVFESICLVHKNFLWNELQRNVMDVQFANMMLAVLCRNAMKGESMHTMPYRGAISTSNTTNVTNISLGGCDGIEICDTDVMTAATGTENIVFYSTSSNLVDFAYRKGNVYNVFVCVVEKEGQINSNRFREIVNPTERISGSYVHYFYVVPSFRFNAFSVTTLPDQGNKDLELDRNKIGIVCLDDPMKIDGACLS